MTPTLGLALIARNEADTLPTLLASIEGAFDQVVLVDTGSTDDTLEVFASWASRQDIACETAGFEWCDDFAAARSFADSLLETDWRCWADCDDELVGAEHLRTLAANTPDHVAGLIGSYDYAMDQHGNVVCVLKRERLVRAGMGEWVGRVHEAQVLKGPTLLMEPGEVRWVHRKALTGPQSSKRNLRILRSWVKAEPDNARVLAYLGTEEAAMGRPVRALRFFRRYLALKDTAWDEERAQVHRKLAACLVALGRNEQARQVALEALKVLPSWPDSYLSLAEACYGLGEHAKAIEWATEALRRGMPDSLLILNPTDYSFQPRLVMAAALGALGRTEEALRVAEEALQIIPDHGELAPAAGQWRSVLKREHTAATFAGCAEMLIAHDEQLKALVVLEQAVPYFATDHPRIVALRSQVRERLHWIADPDAYAEHYETGGSKAEDFIADEHVTDLCERLPRARFLADGIAEQLAEAA